MGNRRLDEPSSSILDAPLCPCIHSVVHVQSRNTVTGSLLGWLLSGNATLPQCQFGGLPLRRNFDRNRTSGLRHSTHASFVGPPIDGVQRLRFPSVDIEVFQGPCSCYGSVHPGYARLDTSKSQRHGSSAPLAPLLPTTTCHASRRGRSLRQHLRTPA